MFESAVYLGLGFGFRHLYAELDEGVHHRPGGHVLSVHLTHDGAHVVFVRDEVGVLGAKFRQFGLVRRLEGRHTPRLPAAREATRSAVGTGRARCSWTRPTRSPPGTRYPCAGRTAPVPGVLGYPDIETLLYSRK